MYTIDASVWVNGFDHREPGHATSRQLLERLRVQGLPIIEPTLMLAEVAGRSVGLVKILHGLRPLRPR